MMLKVNKESLIKEKAGISYLEILILIVSIFAFSYFVYEVSKGLEVVSAQEVEKTETLTGWQYNWTTTSEVKKESEVWRCCQETKEGVICQDLPEQICEDECSTQCIPSKCENVASCEPGCCFDADEGLCSPNSPKYPCEVKGGKWYDDEACNILECRLGCCVLGDETQFVTEKRCEIISGFYGLQEVDFRPEIRIEIECLALAHIQVKGACIIGEGEEKTCKFITKSECLQLTENALNFHQGILCSNSELETNCKKTSETICVKGKDDVYYVDSCGNSDEIYEECNYPESKCVEGKCKDLNCKSAPYVVDAQGKVLERKDRVNGESWCVYDGYIGEGKDVVGSRHWKYYCSEGEVKIEPCQDYRQEICVEGIIEGKDGKKFSNAGCRINRWRECLKYNEKEGQEKCGENADCVLKKINVDDGFKFDFCAPAYPSGFDLKDENRKETSKQLCSMANQECIVIYEKKISGWECVANCDCESNKFTKQMNDLCISLGDCGGYVNIEEKTDDAYAVSGAPKINLDNYKKYAKPVPGQIAEPGDVKELIGMVFGSEYESENGEEALKKSLGVITGVGGIGAGAALLGGASATAWVMLGGQILGAAAGAISGYFIAKITGATGEAANLAVASGSVGGVLATVQILQMQSAIAQGAELVAWGPLGGWLGFLGPILFWAAVFAIAAIVITKMLGIGDTKEKIVEFKCLPWQAPIGGDDCSKCGDELKSCSEYRCESLGQRCQFINEGTEEEQCISVAGDAKPAKINPWEEMITEGYKYDEVKDFGFKVKQENGECVPEFSLLVFGISTDEAAQCKYDIEDKNYEEMENYVGESNLYRENHIFPFTIPSPEAFASEFGLDYKYVLDKIGELRFYVKCKDIDGNVNSIPYLIETCIKPGPDLTAPWIIGSNPPDKSYIKFDVSEQPVTLYINEPADCKWSGEDEVYAEMENEMQCETGLQHVGLYGWECKDTLKLNDNNKFYFKCKDQPWLAGTVNESKKNVNEQSYILELKKSANKLNILKIEPEKGTEIKGGNEPMSVTLKIETSGGAEDGKSTCDFRFTEDGTWIQFKETFFSEHEQVFTQMMRGTHTIYVRCKDIAGNEDEDSTNFKLRVDRSSPKIVRVYNEGNLKIITSEDAECVYSFDNCNFKWGEAMEMSGLQREHSASWQKGMIYHIKCKDLWDNKPDGCSIIIKAV